MTQEDVEKASGMQGYQDVESYNDEILNVHSAKHVLLLARTLDTTIAEIFEIDCQETKSIDVKRVLESQLDSGAISLSVIADQLGYYIEGVQGLRYGDLGDFCLIDLFVLANILEIPIEGMFCYVST